MNQKLLSLKPNVYYDISQHQERESIISAIKYLQSQNETFRFNDDETKFQRLSTDPFDLKEEQGYSVVKVGRSEQLMYNGKILAIR